MMTFEEWLSIVKEFEFDVLSGMNTERLLKFYGEEVTDCDSENERIAFNYVEMLSREFDEWTVKQSNYLRYTYKPTGSIGYYEKSMKDGLWYRVDFPSYYKQDGMTDEKMLNEYRSKDVLIEFIEKPEFDNDYASF